MPRISRAEEREWAVRQAHDELGRLRERMKLIEDWIGRSDRQVRKTAKVHWTQTKEGRQRMREIAKKAHKERTTP